MRRWSVQTDAVAFADLATSEDPIAWLQRRAGQTFRELPSRSTFDFHVGDRRYVAKVHHGVGVGAVLRTLPRAQLPVFDAATEYHALLRARSAGVRVPTPIALGVREGPAVSRRSFLVMEAVEHARTVADELADTQVGAALRARRIRQIAVMLRRLHAAGLRHRDLYLVHFLVCADDELCLIDLHRAQRYDALPQAVRVRELGALAFTAPGLSQAEALRFVAHYGDADRARDGAFWRRVRARAAQLTRRGARG